MLLPLFVWYFLLLKGREKVNLQNSHCTEYPLAKILSSHFFGKPSYSLYVWRKKIANHVLPSVVCVVVAIFVARGYIETNLQKSSSHPRLCEEGSLTAILHVTDYDSCVFLPAEFFWQTPILECVCVGYFLFRCGCQLAEVHISSLLIWGRLLDNYFATHAVCVWSTFCFSLLVKDIETNLQKSTSPPHLSGCLLNNYFANHAILCVCVEHFLFQEDIETNLQKCTSPPHLSELRPSQLASLFVPRALHSIMLVAEVGRRVKAQRDHKIESVWKVADLKWSLRWTSFVFESTGPNLLALTSPPLPPLSLLHII